MGKIQGLNCILLIDDDEATNYIHKRIIQKADLDCEVISMTSATEALDFLKSENAYAGQKFPQPGIIFLDINMPVMNGWEFLEEYEKLPQEQKARVVMAMLTTSLNPDDAKRAEELNVVQDFMHKPLSADKVTAIVHAHFEI